MAGAKKIDDTYMLQLNSVGVTLRGIAKRMDCHHTSIAHRLKLLDIPPADTRRSFMEDVFNSLSYDQQKFLINQVGLGGDVKDYISLLIRQDYLTNKGKTP